MTGVRDRRMGFATSVMSSIVAVGLRSSDSASANACAMSFTGPHGTPSGVSVSNQCCAGRVRSRSWRISNSASTCSTLSAFATNRSSVASSGTSSTEHSRRNCRSLPTASTIGWSAVGNTSYGAIEGCRLPIGFGTEPASVKPALWFTMLDNNTDNRSSSTNCPCPVASRCRNAARMPTHACNPVSTSTSATPVLTGSYGPGPVTLINPPTACASRS